MIQRIAACLSLALGGTLILSAPALAQAPAQGVAVAEMQPIPEGQVWSEPGPVSSTGFQPWLSVDAVMGWVQHGSLPPIITTSPSSTARAQAGVLGLPTTQTIVGGGPAVNEEVRGGWRIGVGGWIDDRQSIGVEASFRMLESLATNYAPQSDGSVILARPYIDATNNTAQAALIAYPGFSSGSAYVRASSGNFYDGRFDIFERVVNHGGFHLDALIGYRFYRYDEGLTIDQTALPTDTNFVPGTRIQTRDSFTTQNEFHGIDFGLRTEFAFQDFTLGLSASIAVGELSRDTNIGGGQVVTVPGSAPVRQNAGLYALSSNIGQYSSEDWTIMPEFGVNLGWQATRHVRFNIGYSLLFMGQVALAADQVDQTINPNLFPSATGTPTTPSRPTFDQQLSDVWIQTFNIGLELRF